MDTHSRNAHTREGDSMEHAGIAEYMDTANQNALTQQKAERKGDPTVLKGREAFETGFQR